MCIRDSGSAGGSFKFGLTTFPESALVNLLPARLPCTLRFNVLKSFIVWSDAPLATKALRMFLPSGLNGAKAISRALVEL